MARELRKMIDNLEREYLKKISDIEIVWTPVSAELPAISVNLLCMDDLGTIRKGFYASKTWFVWSDKEFVVSSRKIKYWAKFKEL